MEKISHNTTYPKRLPHSRIDGPSHFHTRRSNLGISLILFVDESPMYYNFGGH
jgi:hypothetical protein